MPTIVIAGQARNVGKTSLLCAILRAFPSLAWTAIKITPHPHTPLTLTQEHDPTAARDTSRYLAAGAQKAFLLQLTDVEQGLNHLDEITQKRAHVLIESNTFLLHRQPDLALLVAQNHLSHIKTSALAILDRVDAVVIPAKTTAKQGITVNPETYTSDALLDLVRSRLELIRSLL